MGRKQKKKSMTKRLFVYATVLTLLFGGWAFCWPRVMRYVTAHKHRKIQTELYGGKFADMNPIQLEAAKRYGITPVDDRSSDFDGCPRLTEIKSCQAYSIDRLTHSVPYLTPAAAELLKEIGEEFQARMLEKGMSKCRIVVTSVLRTKEDVSLLKKVNGNASENSAHCYATTFDISYYRFQTCGWVSWDVYDDSFVKILADVLTKKRKERLCYVRFETKQHCFHVTSRS